MTRASPPSTRPAPGARLRRRVAVSSGARRETAQLLLLAGIILVLGFITTALMLNQIGNLEKEVAEEQQTPLLTEYRFFRDRVGTSLSDATTSSTDNATFHAIFDSMSDTFRRMAQEKGYDFEVVLAAGGLDLNRTEFNYTSYGWPQRVDVAGTQDDMWYNEGRAIREDGRLHNNTPYHSPNEYWVWSHDDLVQLGFGGASESWDGGNDGIVYAGECEANPGSGCIQAAVVYLRMADTEASIEEFVVYSLNAT